MPKTTRQMIAALLLLGTATGFAVPAAAAKKEEAPKASGLKLSKPVQAALAEAQKAQAAGDLPGALAKVRAAEAVPGVTPDDVYMTNAVKLNVAIATRTAAGTATPNPADPLLEEALNGMIATGKVSTEDKPKFIRNLSSLALQRGDYNTATKHMEELVALTPNDADAVANLAQLYQKQKQSGKAVETLNRAIAARKASGQPVDESWYRSALGIAYDSKLAAQIQPSAIALVTAYPNPVNWRDALVILRDSSKLDDQGNLDVMRLMAAAGALNGERDFAEYAETASMKGLPGEAKAALAAGKAKGALNATKPFVVELSKTVDGKVAADRAALPGLDRESRAAANGKAALGTADAYFGYGDYAKAADLYKVALTKGSVDADTANLRLGAALARSGDKAGATAALGNVHAGTRATLAQYWLIWLGQQKA